MSCKVLLADDDDGYRFPIQALLEDYGYTVLQANSKEDVLRYAREADFRIIDARLPTGEVEGIQAVLELADEGVRPPTPVLFISVMPQPDDKVQPLSKKGIRFEWVEKPFELELLLRRIQAIRGE